MIGKTLSHFEIVGELGTGGMSTVYRARDTKLGRDVALKVLPPEMASDSARVERFQREARAVAALNHPNIVVIHSVEEADGVHFLTMEVVEGRSLKQLISEEGVDLARFFDIGIPLADTLSAAHHKGITHRDLKTANIMVTEGGRPKVLDFGLAKVFETAEENVLDSEIVTQARTREGVVMGTVPYMSPEQVQAQRIDHRTDIFSFGIILYEMASGRRPFHGNSGAALISSILRDRPRSVHEINRDLPEALSRIIDRCLEKNVEERFQTAREVRDQLDQLEALGRGSAIPPEAPRVRESDALWIAVLPFANASTDPELASFADGLAEDIITGLSRFSYLSVVSRNSTLRYRDQGVDARQVGEALGARYVMEGGVRKAGTTVRVNVQLVDAHTGANLWAETYDRNLETGGIFEAQDAIRDRVVATVADGYGVLVRSMAANIQDRPDEELSASNWLARLFAYRQLATPDEHAALRDGLERAVAREPRNADAAAERAVEIDPTNQLGHQVLAQAQFFRRDLKAFRPTAERAMSLNPLDGNTHGILGVMIVHTGEFERGASITRRAMELNPHHADWYHFGPLWEHFHNNEYERALESISRVNLPGFFWKPLAVASVCGHMGRHAEAEAAVRDLLELDPDFVAHARRRIESWHFASGLLEPILSGLEKAGLEIPGELSS